MTRHPFFAVCDMVRRSAMVAKENADARRNVMDSFELGDLSEPEFFRAMRHLGADDHEIAEFVQFVQGDE